MEVVQCRTTKQYVNENRNEIYFSPFLLLQTRMFRIGGNTTFIFPPPSSPSPYSSKVVTLLFTYSNGPIVQWYPPTACGRRYEILSPPPPRPSPHAPAPYFRSGRGTRGGRPLYRGGSVGTLSRHGMLNGSLRPSRSPPQATGGSV